MNYIAENEYFDQRLECVAPKHWSNNTTVGPVVFSLFVYFWKSLKLLFFKFLTSKLSILRLSGYPNVQHN